MIKQGNHSYLELNHVVKDFGGLRAVDHVSFNIQKGEVASIIGPNGAGKTTLLNLISGVLPLTDGEIWFKGQKINSIAPWHICNIGINRTFQDLQLFESMSVVENVMVGRHIMVRACFLESMFPLGRIRKEERESFDWAMEALSTFDLQKKAFGPVSSLNLKERKLLALARALAAEPELLLLDEPGGGLSAEEIEDLREKIVQLQRQGITIIIVEHRLELLIDISNHLIVLDFGHWIVEGSPIEVLHDERVITAYLGKELKGEYGSSN
jgi:ABC-type branched-subunit amino acid transport system ATPase component